MRIFIAILLAIAGIISTNELEAQSLVDTTGGQVSYKTSQNIYVRFKSTEGMEPGDTLYTVLHGELTPIARINHLSSSSTVGTPLDTHQVVVGMRLVHLRKNRKEIASPDEPEEIIALPEEIYPVPEADEVVAGKDDVVIPKSKKQVDNISGRLLAASYIYFSDNPKGNKQRMRYTFSMNAKELGNTNISAESYISFRHTVNEWQEVKDNFKRAFKVYTLAFKYKPDESTALSLGRKINHHIANVGAIDGIQAERKWSSIHTGVFAGFRPDHQDYGFNAKLLQYGAYAGNTIESKNGSMQNYLAFAEQRNDGKTDRRFTYFQHVNSSIKRLYIFTSFEFDLFKLENEIPKSTLDFTSLYASVRYRASDKLSLFGSYDARKNIIYYETYKNFIDQLIEDETRQGLRFSFTYRPFKRITLGSSAGYRFQKGNPAASKNLHSYLTVSRIPQLNVSATASAVVIQSLYNSGFIYGLRVSRDIFNGKLFSEAEFRMVRYKYNNSEFTIRQSIAGANLSWRMTKKFSLGFNYEGEIMNGKLSNRIYTHIIQRF